MALSESGPREVEGRIDGWLQQTGVPECFVPIVQKNPQRRVYEGIALPRREDFQHRGNTVVSRTAQCDPSAGLQGLVSEPGNLLFRDGVRPSSLRTATLLPG